MKTYSLKAVLALTCVAFIAATLPVKAQSSDVGLSIKVLPSTTSPGSTVAVAGLVTNNTNKKMRADITFTSAAPCGTESTIGFSRLSLDPGQTKFLTVSYTVPADACVGTYTVSISADSGNGKTAVSASTPSASAFLSVQ